MNTLQILHTARRVLQIRQAALVPITVRLQSDGVIQDRPWDKTTRAVVYDLPDVSSPSEMKSRQLPGVDSHSSQNYEPNSDKNVQKSGTSEAHFDLRYQNWERNQNKDFRSKMKQWDIQPQVFKTSRLIKHQEYGTYGSNRGNISGRPSPSNTTPSSLPGTKEVSSRGSQRQGNVKS